MLSEDESVCSHVTYRVCERRSTDIRSCVQTYAMHVAIPTQKTIPLKFLHSIVNIIPPLNEGNKKN